MGYEVGEYGDRQVDALSAAGNYYRIPVLPSPGPPVSPSGGGISSFGDQFSPSPQTICAGYPFRDQLPAPVLPARVWKCAAAPAPESAIALCQSAAIGKQQYGRQHF